MWEILPNCYYSPQLLLSHVSDSLKLLLIHVEDSPQLLLSHVGDSYPLSLSLVGDFYVEANCMCKLEFNYLVFFTENLV